MLLYRALERNAAEGCIEALEDRLHGALAPLDPRFECGVIATTLVPARYLALPEGDGQLGWPLMISFWAWRDTEAETMANLRRLLESLAAALRTLSALA